MRRGREKDRGGGRRRSVVRRMGEGRERKAKREKVGSDQEVQIQQVV